MLLEKAIATAREEVARRARLVAEDFMSIRKTKPSGNDRWSDLFVRVREDRGALGIEWKWRQWFRPKAGGKARNYLRYLPEKQVMRRAQDWEQDEVARTREALAALKQAHRQLTQISERLQRLGLLGDEADLVGGFVPLPHSLSVREAEGTEDQGDE